jgi:aldehyde:ferredoxin oxidoreductase
MESKGGFMGEYLRVNLKEKKYTRCKLNEEQINLFIGCSGYSVKLLWDELIPGIDPLSEDNKIIFATGPMTGTLCPSGGSYELCFKSPLTNAWCQSRSGGSFGSKLKYSGYDFIIIEGVSEKPIYLYIHNKKVEFKDAFHLWGKGTQQTTEIILREIGDPKASVAAIGQAGENLVRFAAVINDFGRAAGRGGGGAILGSKKLKAIAVNGNYGIKVANPKKFFRTIIEAEKKLDNYPFNNVNIYGTASLLEIQNAHGSLPTKNFQLGQFVDAEKIGGDALTENFLIKRRACFGCSMGCGRCSQVKEGKWKTPPIDGPEYETLAMLGSMNLNSNLPSIIYANYLCNDYGIDTISTGAVISFAIEASEKNILNFSEKNNKKLKWGDADLIITLIENIANRRGLGDILAEGVYRASKKIGKESEGFALHVKGMELPAHEPRGESKIMALQYAVSPRGACHMHPNWAGVWDSTKFDCGMKEFGLPWPPTDKFSEETFKKGLAYKYIALQGEISEILGTCIFHSWGSEDTCLTPKLYTKMLNALVGWDINEFELLKAAERSWVLKRCFNIREGFTRKDDNIPTRLKESLPAGPSRGQRINNIDGLIDRYFEVCGWDRETGIPKEEVLKKLDLYDICKEIKKNGK